ncbi:MAG TPA: phosphate ABC transporter permease PstA [Chitinophagales bacterium]|nr:phosphate ABC transporter permease PstA [Chitinophagales bacterium]
MFWRKLEECIFNILIRIATVIIIGSLFVIVLTILVKGLPAMSWDMISKSPSGGFYLGKEGGVLNAIVGSLYLGFGASLFALMLSIPVVVYMNIYAPANSKFAQFIRTSLDILYGIPSIVYGAFGFIIMIYLGLKVSLLAGIITVGLLVLPIMARTMDEVIRTIPKELGDASLSLGATKWETAMKVILRQAFPGILTAMLLGFGRAIGDAASVIFTTGFTDNVPTTILQPAATLPLAIFFQLGSPIPEVVDRAYASALILTILILIISISSRLLSRRFNKNVIK